MKKDAKTAIRRNHGTKLNQIFLLGRRKKNAVLGTYVVTTDPDLSNLTGDLSLH